MAKTKNMHYLSQMISRNFSEKDSVRTFLLYDPNTRIICDRNINKLFSAHRPWGQDFENVLSGNDYENVLSPILRDLASCKIDRHTIIGPSEITECQFNGIIIDDDKQRSALSKLVLQSILLQRSAEKPQAEIEAKLMEIFTSDFALKMNLGLVEINPRGNYAPLILTDGLLFSFLCPNNDPKTLGHICFMVPISEQRFLLWVNGKKDFDFFCRKYSNIHYLNLCRIEQHEKKCKIALAKNPKNEMYLKGLVSQMANFNSDEQVKISIIRDWE